MIKNKYKAKYKKDGVIIIMVQISIIFVLAFIMVYAFASNL